MDRTKVFFRDNKSYYMINIVLLFILGQWPYQSAISSFIMLTLALSLGPLIIIPQTIAMYQLRSSANDVIECLTPILGAFMCTVKLLNLKFNQEKIKKLLTGIADDWKNLKKQQEIQALRRYMKYGKFLTIIYVFYVYVTMFVFALLPRFSTIMIKHLPGTNQTIGIELSPFIVDYRVDAKKYYYLLMFHVYSSAFFHSTIAAAPDILFIVFVQHVCGMFELLGYELTHAIEDGNLNINLNPKLKDEEIIYSKLTNAIKKHNHIIEFVNLIESSYTIALFFQVGLNMIMLSITAVQAMMYSNVPHEFIRCALFAFAQFLHLFFECWQAQQLMDSGNRIHDYTYISNWYRMSLRCRKLLILIMMRTNILCKITAGKVYTLSFQSFSAVVRTSVSYIAVLQSIG